MSAPALPAFWAMRRGLYAIVANDRDSCREKLQEFAEEKRQSVRLHNNTYPMRLVMRWPFNVVVCASGGGGNFQALIDKRGEVGYEIVLLIADRPCGAVDRAAKHGIPFAVLDAAVPREQRMEAFDKAIPADADLIVLAGFMPIVPAWICEKWPRKIINTHPSLLPKYGGKGMVGVRVQEAVMRAGEREAGCTVHYVSPEIDAGEIILQKSIEVDYSETPWQLGGRVFIEENRLLVEAVRQIKAENGRNDGV